jgi:hypothetical protein
MDNSIRLIDILNDLAREPRTLSFRESAHIEALGLELQQLDAPAKAQRLVAEGLAPDALETLDLDDDVAELLTEVLAKGSHQ